MYILRVSCTCERAAKLHPRHYIGDIRIYSPHPLHVHIHHARITRGRRKRETRMNVRQPAYADVWAFPMDGCRMGDEQYLYKDGLQAQRKMYYIYM